MDIKPTVCDMTTGKEGEVGEAEQRTDVSAALLAGWNAGIDPARSKRGFAQGIHLYCMEQKQLL